MPDDDLRFCAPTPGRNRSVLYDRIGGEPVLRALVTAFYDILENEPAGQSLYLLHMRGHGIAHSREEQFNFMSGFLGGPPLYVERYGHSNIRKMHEHVDIDVAAKDAWLQCMSMAVERIGLIGEARDLLMQHLRTVATALVNRH